MFRIWKYKNRTVTLFINLKIYYVQAVIVGIIQMKQSFIKSYILMNPIWKEPWQFHCIRDVLDCCISDEVEKMQVTFVSGAKHLSIETKCDMISVWKTRKTWERLLWCFQSKISIKNKPPLAWETWTVYFSSNSIARGTT